jgi:hypothetical protein
MASLLVENKLLRELYKDYPLVATASWHDAFTRAAGLLLLLPASRNDLHRLTQEETCWNFLNCKL